MVLRFLLLFLLTTSSLQALILEELVDSNEFRKVFKDKKVGYYTGSFDPIHKGHTGFVQGVLEEGLCDYVLILPAWGGDSYKERAPISLRLEMVHALFADHPQVIVTKLSPLEVQKKLTRVVPGQTIRGYPLVNSFDLRVEFIGLIGSDTALNLSLSSSNEDEEVSRKKRLQVFMRGVSIPEKHGSTTIGSLMALPVSRFIVGVREGDNLSLLKGMVGDRPISNLYINKEIAHLSSSLIKGYLKNQKSVSEMIDPNVIKVISKYALYK